MGFLTGFLQAAGLAIFCYGAYLIAPFIGFLIAGLALFLLGWVLDGGSLPDKTKDDVNGSA